MSHNHTTPPLTHRLRWVECYDRAKLAKRFRALGILALAMGFAAVAIAALHPAISGNLHPGLDGEQAIADLNFVITETLMLAFAGLADFGFGFESRMATEDGRRRFISYTSALSHFIVVWTAVMLLFCCNGHPLYIAIVLSEGIMGKLAMIAICKRAHEAVDAWCRLDGEPAETQATSA